MPSTNLSEGKKANAMKTRFLQIVYWLSIVWLGLLTSGWVLGTATFSDFTLNVLKFGWPALIGLLACFIIGGRFLLPPKGN